MLPEWVHFVTGIAVIGVCMCVCVHVQHLLWFLDRTIWVYYSKNCFFIIYFLNSSLGYDFYSVAETGEMKGKFHALMEVDLCFAYVLCNAETDHISNMSNVFTELLFSFVWNHWNRGLSISFIVFSCWCTWVSFVQ